MVAFTSPPSIHTSSPDAVKSSKDHLFEELVQRYYQAVVSVFERRGFSLDEARDLAQKTFLRVYENMEDDREDLPPWSFVLRTATNVGHNWIEYLLAEKRNVKATTSLDDMDPLPHLSEVGLMPGGRPAPPLEEVLVKEEIQRALEAMAELAPAEQRCLMMVAQRYSYREIALVQQDTVDGVKGRLKRARKKLKEKLDDAERDSPKREVTNHE